MSFALGILDEETEEVEDNEEEEEGDDEVLIGEQLNSISFIERQTFQRYIEVAQTENAIIK